MKIYSILAHLDPMSLNGQLFDIANEYFTELGHEVKTIHLHQHIDQLNQASNVLHTVDLKPHERKNASLSSYNYNKASKGGYLSTFAKQEIENLKSADFLFIQMPVLVWTIPAILKSYMENTFIANSLFSLYNPWDSDFEITKFMTGKRVFVSMVTGSGPEMTAAVMGSVDNLVNPIRSMFEFIGYEWVDPYITWGTTRTWGPREEYITNFKLFLQSKGDFSG